MAAVELGDIFLALNTAEFDFDITGVLVSGEAAVRLYQVSAAGLLKESWVFAGDDPLRTLCYMRGMTTDGVNFYSNLREEYTGLGGGHTLWNEYVVKIAADGTLTKHWLSMINSQTGQYANVFGTTLHLYEADSLVWSPDDTLWIRYQETEYPPAPRPFDHYFQIDLVSMTGTGLMYHGTGHAGSNIWLYGMYDGDRVLRHSDEDYPEDRLDALALPGGATLRLHTEHYEPDPASWIWGAEYLPGSDTLVIGTQFDPGGSGGNISSIRTGGVPVLVDDGLAVNEHMPVTNPFRVRHDGATLIWASRYIKPRTVFPNPENPVTNIFELRTMPLQGGPVMPLWRLTLDQLQGNLNVENSLMVIKPFTAVAAPAARRRFGWVVS